MTAAVTAPACYLKKIVTRYYFYNTRYQTVKIPSKSIQPVGRLYSYIF